ncbi:hypothetical protein J3E68DRAFT_393891 [Trichoderma sp. SZMC 28012]
MMMMNYLILTLLQYTALGMHLLSSSNRLKIPNHNDCTVTILHTTSCIQLLIPYTHKLPTSTPHQTPKDLPHLTSIETHLSLPPTTSPHPVHPLPSHPHLDLHHTLPSMTSKLSKPCSFIPKPHPINPSPQHNTNITFVKHHLSE